MSKNIHCAWCYIRLRLERIILKNNRFFLNAGELPDSYPGASLPVASPWFASFSCCQGCRWNARGEQQLIAMLEIIHPTLKSHCHLDGKVKRMIVIAESSRILLEVSSSELTKNHIHFSPLRVKMKQFYVHQWNLFSRVWNNDVKCKCNGCNGQRSGRWNKQGQIKKALTLHVGCQHHV